MKIDVKLPNGGRFKLEHDVDFGFVVVCVVLILCLVGFFWLIWVLR